MEKLVVATKNQGKLREVKALLADYPLEVLSLKDFPGLPEIEETGSTFAENAVRGDYLFATRKPGVGA